MFSQEKEEEQDLKPIQALGRSKTRIEKLFTSRPRYPVTVDELSRADLQSLTQILHVDNTKQTIVDTDSIVTSLIDRLPAHLRSSFLFRLVPNSIIPSAVVCPLHKGLNRHIIRHVWSLVKREVTSHLDIMYDFPESAGAEEKTILRSLRAITGMWTVPSASVSPPGAWDFQVNRCEACMLARIGAQPIALRNIRIVLLSRNRTRKKRKPPRLIPWVDSWIAHHEEYKTELFVGSGQKAFAMKTARKAAIKARSNERRKRRYRDEEAKGRVETDSFATDRNERPEPTDNGLTVPGLNVARGEKEKKTIGRPGQHSVEDVENEIDEIIKMYAGVASKDELTIEQQGAVMDPPPFSTHSRPGKVPRNSRADHPMSSLGPMSKSGQHESVYQNPRQGQGWLDYLKASEGAVTPSTRYSGKGLSTRKPQEGSRGWPNNLGCDSSQLPTDVKRKRRSERTDQLAGEDLALISPGAGEYSDSEYSQAAWETASIPSISPAHTTWSLLYKDK